MTTAKVHPRGVGVSDPATVAESDPTPAARLRELLELGPDADDRAILAAIRNLRLMVNTALSVGFDRTFALARAAGHVHDVDELAWRAMYHRDPDAVRDALERRWETTS